MTQGNGHTPQPNRMNILIDQVDRLTEVVTTGFADLKATTERQSQVAERQEQNISRLVDVVAQQAEIVNALLRDRQGG
jgi:hypothetical protein